MEYEGHFTTHDGIRLYERGWEPDEEVRADLVLVHGFGEHCSRYDETARVFNAHGIAVHTYDQRGFGRSPGKRSYLSDFDELPIDLDTFLENVRGRLRTKHLFLMGHSFGGLVLASYMLKHSPDVAGLVFSSPFLTFPADVSKFRIAFVTYISRVMPWLPVGSVDESALSRDPEAIERSRRDELSFHGRVAAHTAAEMVRAFQNLHPQFDKISQPVYIVHGEDDKISPNLGSRMLHDRCSSKDKMLTIVPGGYHELWNDICKDEFNQGVIDWILAHV